jgi:hypothetical protein
MFAWLFGDVKPPAGPERDVRPAAAERAVSAAVLFPGAEIFLATDAVSGVCRVNSRQPIAHRELTAALLGQVRIESDRSLNSFHAETQQIAPPGSLSPDATIPFKLSLAKVKMPPFYGSYYSVRWLVQITSPKASAPVAKGCPTCILFVERRTRDVWPPLAVKMEVGGMLIVDFHINQPYIDVGSCLLGLVVFQLVKIRVREIKFIIRREEEYDNGIVSSKMVASVLDFAVLDGGAVMATSSRSASTCPASSCGPVPRKPRGHCASSTQSHSSPSMTPGRSTRRGCRMTCYGFRRQNKGTDSFDDRVSYFMLFMSLGVQRARRCD